MESYEYFGKKMKNFRDDHGFIIGGKDDSIPKQKSVLDPNVVYKKNVCISTSAQSENS